MMIVEQMSVGQLASGVFGAICYSRTQAVSSSLQILHPLETLSLTEADDACDIGFTWVRSRFSLGQINHVANQSIEIWGPLNIICDLVITVCMVTFVSRSPYGFKSPFSNWYFTSSSGIAKEQSDVRHVCISQGLYKLLLRREWQQVKCLVGPKVFN